MATVLVGDSLLWFEDILSYQGWLIYYTFSLTQLSLQREITRNIGQLQGNSSQWSEKPVTSPNRVGFAVWGTSFSDFPLWLSRLRAWHSVLEDAGSIPGFTEWAKDRALPQAVELVADVADIWCCHGCAIGLQLQLWFNPHPGNFQML